jgi:hypothetical protein
MKHLTVPTSPFVDRHFVQPSNLSSRPPGTLLESALETTDYLEFIARVISHIPEKGQVMVRYYGPYANAHRGKVRKADRIPALQGMIEEEPRPVPSKGWAEMIRRAAGIFFFCEGKG